MPDMLGPASIGISQTITAFTTFLPKFSEIRKADPTLQKELAADVRMGEIAGATLAIGVGAIVSSLSKSSVPIVVSALMALILICLYESTLRADRPMESKNA